MRRRRQPSESDDRNRIVHMRNAARDAVFFIKDRNRSELDTDPMLRRAMVNCVQEIGEAAARISDAGRSRLAHLPWGQIVGMRHILVHMYDRIDLDSVWSVAITDLPHLIQAIDEALPNWPEAKSS